MHTTARLTQGLLFAMAISSSAARAAPPPEGSPVVPCKDDDASVGKALIQRAVAHHKAAIEWKKSAQSVSPPDSDKLDKAIREYRAAARGYSRYLDRYAHAQDAYEYRFSWAEALFYSGEFAKAAEQYQWVRDSKIDTHLQEDAAFDVVKARELLRDEQVRAGTLVLPQRLAKRISHGPVTPRAIPEDLQSLQLAYDDYVRLVPTSTRLAKMAYQAADIDLRYQHWDDARARFEQIIAKHPSDPEATEAGRAILYSYRMENNTSKSAEWPERLAKQSR